MVILLRTFLPFSDVTIDPSQVELSDNAAMPNTIYIPVSCLY